MSDWAYTSKEFVVKVDPKDFIAEKNENNNEARVSIYFGGEEICDNNIDDNGDGEIDEGCEKPDLLIKSITHGTPVFNDRGKLSDITFNVTIESKYACAKNFKLGMFEGLPSSASRKKVISIIVVDQLCPGEDKTFFVEYKLEGNEPLVSIFELQKKDKKKKVKDTFFDVARIIPLLFFDVDSDNEIVETNETNNKHNEWRGKVCRNNNRRCSRNL